MRHFKIDFGFNGSQTIPIDETELEKAVYAHITGKVAVFKNGSVSGDKIIAISPDIHGVLGWGYDHKLDDYDWADWHKESPKYDGYLGAIKDKVAYLIETKQEYLIGKNVEIPELESKKETPISKLTTGLAQKMSLNNKTRTDAQEDANAEMRQSANE